MSIKEYVDPFTGQPITERADKQKPIKGQSVKAARLADLSMSL